MIDQDFPMMVFEKYIYIYIIIIKDGGHLF